MVRHLGTFKCQLTSWTLVGKNFQARPTFSKSQNVRKVDYLGRRSEWGRLPTDLILDALDVEVDGCNFRRCMLAKDCRCQSYKYKEFPPRAKSLRISSTTLPTSSCGDVSRTRRPTNVHILF